MVVVLPVPLTPTTIITNGESSLILRADSIGVKISIRQSFKIVFNSDSS